MISTRSGIWRLCTLAMHTGLHVFEVGKEYVSITTNNHEIPAESDRRQLTHSFCDEFLFDVVETKYIIYALSADSKEIVVEKVSESQSYDEFLEDLPAGACRYAVYDFEYELEESEGKRNKLCFFTWSPDEAKIKNKMLYAASKKAIRDAPGRYRYGDPGH
ncbi:hypothetical protein Pst134EB_022047 [Puccinia striiformis f. sp. tritici]|nr:hypothetical protein Pst134EB_022047 [Puccinia striiformis f. sp. tritici]